LPRLLVSVPSSELGWRGGDGLTVRVGHNLLNPVLLIWENSGGLSVPSTQPLVKAPLPHCGKDRDHAIEPDAPTGQDFAKPKDRFPPLADIAGFGPARA